MTTSPHRLVIANVQKTIYHWISNELSGEVPKEHIIWRNQSEALPARPCVAMKLIEGPTPTGFGENVQYISGPNYNVGGQRTLTLSVQVFGDSRLNPKASQVGNDLRDSLGKQTVLDALRGGGIGVLDKGALNNLTALEESEYEERVGFDVIMCVAQNLVDDPGIIETANLTEDVSGP